MRAPALLLAIPLLAGSAISIIATDQLAPQFPVIAGGAAALAVIAATASLLQGDRRDSATAVVIGSLAAGLSLGATAAERAYRPSLLQWFDRAPDRGPVAIEGVLREDAAPAASGISLVLDVVGVEQPRGSDLHWPRSPRRRPLGGVRLTVGGSMIESRAAEWRAGRTIRAPALLRRPSVYLNPGTPDERRTLARRGIALVGSVKSAALVEVVRRGSAAEEAAAAIRAVTRRRLSAYVGAASPRSAAVAAAVLIGDRSRLSQDDERRLQEAGTYHVIAISGGNIAVFAMLVLLAGRVLLVPSRSAAIAAAALLLLYGSVAGGAASVSRAITVAVLVLAARAIDRPGPPLNALGVAALAIVAATPVMVLDAGFILSFAATLAIVVGVSAPAPPSRRDSRLRRAARHAASALLLLWATTLCAETALAPVAATLFARVPVAGLVLNFAAVPLMTVVQIAALGVVATGSWWPAAAQAAGTTVHLASAGLLESARVVDAWPWLSLDVRPPASWLLAAYYGGSLLLLRRTTRRAGALVVAASAVVMFAGPGWAARDVVPRATRPLRIVVLDVGQGDATAVVLPGGRVLLVDTGGLAPISTTPDAFETAPAFDVGERVVTPALRALGVRTLHGLVLTHGDPDHIAGARGVLRRLHAPTVWEGVPVPPHAGLTGLMALAGARSMSWRTVQAGDAERFGEVEVRVLHPPPPEWERQRVRNEDSVVLEARIGKVSIVLPGDIGREGERAILPRLEPGRLVVLKAPHHGSATSSTAELLDRLRPAAVIFSCGRDNRFGHPHPAVVARHRAIGAEIFSTADDGAVFVEADGESVEVRGWLGQMVTFTAAAR